MSHLHTLPIRRLLVPLCALAVTGCALTNPSPSTPVVVIDTSVTNVPSNMFDVDVTVSTATSVPAAQVQVASAPTATPVVFTNQTNVVVSVATPIPVVLANCTVRSDWVPYVVQAGDTLGVLSIATNSELNDLALGNCLGNPDLISVGQTLLLPRLPADWYVQSLNTSISEGTIVPADATQIPAAATAVPNTVVDNTALNAQVAAAPTSVVLVSVSSSSPMIGYVLAEPSFIDYGRFLVAPGEVILRAQGVTNDARVTFFMAPINTNNAPMAMGIDDNMIDGASIRWTFDRTPLLANVWAVATSPDGTEATTNPIVVVNNG
jgi:LysM repeat protein